MTSFQITKALAMLTSKSLAEVSTYFNLKPSEIRIEFKRHGVKIKRGRKRGTGNGRVIVGGVKKDRRVRWQEEKLKEGKCTSCGEPNDSKSLYHCRKCLKRRNEQKKWKRDKEIK